MHVFYELIVIALHEGKIYFKILNMYITDLKSINAFYYVYTLD